MARRSFTSFFGLLVALTCLAGCGGAESQRAALAGLGSPHPTIEQTASFPGLPPLPSATDGAAARAGSFANVRAYYGNGIHSSSGDNIFGERSIVLPSTPPEDMNWAMYSFSNLDGYQPSTLDVGLDVSNNGTAWIGVSNYTEGTWQFFDPATGDASIELGNDNYLSTTGQFYVVVIAYGGSVVTVRHVSVRYENLVFTDFSISGTVLDEGGDPLVGVEMQITPNPDGFGIYTDFNGKYVIHLPAAGSYDVMPDAPVTQHQFSPLQTTVSVDGIETGVDFTGTTIDVEGRVLDEGGVGIVGVLVSLEPGGRQTFTGADGAYKFNLVAAGNYTVTPILATYTFVPNFTAIVVGAADETGVDFEGSGGAPTYSIFGTIETTLGDPLAGALVTLSPGFQVATTDAAGNYSFSSLGAGSYSLTPGLGLYTFNPVEREIDITNVSVNNVDFTATPPPPTFNVLGKVVWIDEDDGNKEYGVPFVDVVASLTSGGPAYKVTETLADGTFTFTGMPNDFYFLSVDAFEYMPGHAFAAVSGNDVSNLNIDTILLGGPTWENFAAGYVGKYCIQCHRPDSQTAVDPYLRTYDEVVDAGTASNARIQNNTMPPGFTNLEIYQRYFQLWRLANYPED